MEDLENKEQEEQKKEFEEESSDDKFPEPLNTPSQEETPEKIQEKEENKQEEEIDLEVGKKVSDAKDNDDFEDDDLIEGNDENIDFSEMKDKVVGFLKNLKGKSKDKQVITRSTQETANKGTEDDDDISFDFKKAGKFFKDNAKWLIPLAFILVAIFVSSFFRMMPSDLPITDQWAQNTVIDFYKNQIKNQINSQYPNLPEQNKDSLIQKELQKTIDGNAQYQQEVAQVSQQFKSQFKDEKGDTYLLAIDPYLWYSGARNVLNHGHLGDTIIDGKSYFSLRDGRLPKASNIQLHPYFSAYLFKILSIFDRDISLMRAIFLMPVILIGLSLIPTFFIGRRIAGNVGGFFAAFFLAVNGALLGRTPGGFADTDPYNILFPLLIAWMFIESYYAKTTNRKIIYAMISGLGVGLYAGTWTGWSTIFLFVILTLIALIVIDIIKKIIEDKKLDLKKVGSYFFNKKIKQQLLVLLTFFITSGVMVTLIQSFSTFSGSFTKPIKFITLKAVGVKSIWPNVLTTVAEFNTVSFSNIISQMGGNLLFWLSLMGLAALTFNNKKTDAKNWIYLIATAIYYAIIIGIKDQLNNPITFSAVVLLPIILGILKVLYYKEKVKLLYAIFIPIWLLATAYAFTKGIRFAILIVPPYAIGLGSISGLIYQKASAGLQSAIHLDIKIGRILVFLVIGLLTITPLTSANNIALNEIPSMNDAWYNSLIKIQQDSPDSIITSWWDFGHWFQAIAQRRVTFDGGDQGERIHWVGRSLQTNNEQEAIGILRMLNCAQETAPHKLNKYINDQLRSVLIVKEVILTDRNQALKIYENAGLTSEQAQEIIELTHCEDLLPNYYITSEDMVSKAGVWGHFGTWDFEKASMYQNTNKLSRNEAVRYLTTNFDLTESEANDLHAEIETANADRWIAPWPGYISGQRKCDRVDENTLRCVNSVQGQGIVFLVNENTFEVSIENNPDLVPNLLVYPKDGQVTETKPTGERKGGFALTLIQNEDGYSSLLSDPLQGAGIFTKLFFMDGAGLSCFEKFDETRQVTGGRIVVWKVDYTCSQ